MRSEKRSQENALPTRLLISDFDKLTPTSYLELQKALRAMGLRSILWPTRSSTPKNPRSRVLIEADQEIAPSEYPDAHRRLIQTLSNATGVSLDVDESSERPDQPQHTPPQHSEPVYIKGSRYRVPPLPLSATKKPQPLGHGTFNFRREIANVLSTQKFHDSLRDLAAHFVAKGMSEGDAITTLQELMQAADPHNARWQARFDDIPRAVRSAVEKFGPPDPSPEIQDVNDLLKNPPEPVEYLVPGLLARGATSLFFGPPKSFKSTIATQMALALTTEAETLGTHWEPFGPFQGGHRVPILDLEQNQQLFVERLRSRFGTTRTHGLLRIDKWGVFDGRGVQALKDLICSEELDAVIVDSLTRVRPPAQKHGNVFDQDAATLQPVTDLSHELNVHISIIGHAGKRRDVVDPTQMIAGTSGLLAAVDDTLVLFQHKGDVDVAPKVRRRLWVTGRNIRHFGGYVLESTGSGFYIVGANTALVRTPYQQRILDVLQNAPEGATPTWIAQQISGDKNERSHVFRALQSMQKQGLVGCVQTRWFTVEQLVAHERGKRARR